MTLSTLQPEIVWNYFDQLRQVPRPSKREEKVRAFIMDWAQAHDFQTRTDSAQNIVVVVPASVGFEDRATIVLQGHLDMVCEKNADTDFDFDNDAIQVEIVDGWVTAKGTTLGADNGIGVVMSMAAATDPAAKHGPLELLFTADEETGLTGATNLDASIVTGHRMINLDSEEQGIFYIGCAGGGDDHLFLDLPRVDISTLGDVVAMRLKVHGLRGGHSGCNIHENRGNALKLLLRTLAELRMVTMIHLSDIDGGDKHNAIPREAVATFCIERSDFEPLADVVRVMRDAFTEEFGKWEVNLSLDFEECDLPQATIEPTVADNLLDLLLCLPHGVLSMSREIPELVETSTNLASVKTTASQAAILTSTRSSLTPALRAARQMITSAGQLAGCAIEQKPAYPGWAPNLDSELLAAVTRIWVDAHGSEPEVTAIHAGLECGVLGERLRDMDMISFGPNITGAHSPDERVEIASVAVCYEFLKRVLATL